MLSIGAPRILVEDRGPDIPDDPLARSRQPLHRVDPSRSRDAGGTGPGLHIARSLLQGLDATLGLANRQGGGQRLEIKLRAAASR